MAFTRNPSTGERLFYGEYLLNAQGEDVVAGIRRSRYIGLARVHLAHLLTAVGLNVLRLGEWFLETKRTKTRVTPFARLMAGAVVT